MASMLHVTDTHLFVDDTGRTRSSRDRSRLVRVLDRFGVSDLEFASAGAGERLREVLHTAVAHERSVLPEGAPLLAVHSGDAEAFGPSWRPGHFTGFDLLQRLFAEVGLSEMPIAVYGNHDVWPGTVALLGLNGPRQCVQQQAIADSAAIVGLLPPAEPLRFVTAHGPDVVIVPLNTVNTGAVRGGIFAYGRLSAHPAAETDVLEQIASYGLTSGDLNIAVMHHPIHFYRPVTLRDRLGIGQLAKSASVGQAFADAGIDVVIAGHRHRLDPAFGQSIDASAGGQPPLPNGMAQLVAISPTIPTDDAAAKRDPEGVPRSGLCLYRFLVAGTSVTIERVIYPTEFGWPNDPLVESRVVHGLVKQPSPSTRGARP